MPDIRLKITIFGEDEITVDADAWRDAQEAGEEDEFLDGYDVRREADYTVTELDADDTTEDRT
jgi:hypothetical protein